MTKIRVFYYLGVACLLWTAISMEHSNNLVIIPSQATPTFDVDNLSKSFGPHMDSKAEAWDKDFKSAITPIEK